MGGSKMAWRDGGRYAVSFYGISIHMRSLTLLMQTPGFAMTPGLSLRSMPSQFLGTDRNQRSGSIWTMRDLI
jgi:hypothetical protein